MKTTRHLWKKRLATAAALTLPLAVMAHDAAGDRPEACPPPHAGGPMALPPHGMFPAAPPPGAMPPYLHGLELTADQQDRLFALLHAQAPQEREQMKTAVKAREELGRLAAAELFDADRARALAATHAQALAQAALMHAELDAKLRALLTPAQRQQLDDARGKAAPRRHGRGS